MHQKQHTHEFDVDLHPGRPDVDSKQRDADLHAAGRADLHLFPVHVELLSADQLLLDVRGRAVSVPAGREDFHGRQHQTEAVYHYRLGYASPLYRHVGYRQVVGSQRHEPSKPGSRTGQALSLDGIARLRLVLPSTRHFGPLRQRRFSLHDHVGADNEAVVSDERRNAAISEGE